MSRKTQKKLRKLLTLVSCAVLLVCVTIGATVAYLTSTKTVTNTFTVGKVDITLNETDVKLDGTKDTDARVTENEYHLLPGHSYIKDPQITVDANSEDCYLFVKVTDAIASIEDSSTAAGKYKTIAEQMTDLGWVELDTTNHIYYATKDVPDSEGATTKTSVFTANDVVKVFNGFTIKGTEKDLSAYVTVKDEDGNVTNGKLIEVVAYAIQKDGFDTPADAWAAAKLVG